MSVIKTNDDYPRFSGEYKSYLGKYPQSRPIWIVLCKICREEHHTICKTTKFCSNQCMNRWLHKTPKLPSNHKQCNLCKRILSFSNFTISKSGMFGLRSRCKFCRSIIRKCKEYNITFKEFITIAVKQKWICAICGDSLKCYYQNPSKIGKFKSISIDHIDPNLDDGVSNYQITCDICNRFKHINNMKSLISWCLKVLRFHGYECNKNK